jgi:nitrous oxidase accessory protein NosD
MNLLKNISKLIAPALLCAMQLAAQPQGRTIAIPAVITEPGTYQLRFDNYFASATAPAIRIQASGVTLDLGGAQILGAGNNTGVGIEVVSAMGVTIKNGNLGGFAMAVTVMNSSAVTIRDLSIRGRDLVPTSGAPEIGIMVVQSNGVVIRDNSLNNVGLGIFMRGGRTRNNLITGNSVNSAANGVFGICYNPADTDPMGPRYDSITNNLISGFRTGIQFGSSSGVNSTSGNTVFHRGPNSIELNETGSLDMNNVKARIQ